MKMRCLAMAVAAPLLWGQPSGDAGWDGELQVYGALRAMMHQGQTGAMTRMDALLPDPDLFAVGALADLAGEITVIAGQAYLAYPQGEEARYERKTTADAGAALLVAAKVSKWRSAAISQAIAFDELDAAIGKLAAKMGLDPAGRFPFLIEGAVEDLRWHVIDGARLAAGPSTHQAHKAAGVRLKRQRAKATLVGFYSARDQGVFTHINAKTHIHCALEDATASGHVDHVIIPAGAIIQFPALD